MKMAAAPAGEWTIEFDPQAKAVRVSLSRTGRDPFIVEMKAIEAQRYALEQIKLAKASYQSFSFRLGDSAELTVPTDQALIFFNQLIDTARKARDGIN
jgi:hypothetical protein